MVENSEEVAAALRARYGDRVQVDLFDFGDHAGITMPEQVGGGRRSVGRSVGRRHGG
jgi:hypothetical protein